MQRIAILGSTGSIGQNALKVIDNLKADCSASALAARSNWKLLAEQIRAVRPAIASLTDENAYQSLKEALNGSSTRLLHGPQALEEIAGSPEVDRVLVALSGADGLKPSLKALQTGKILALANKESMVMAGPLLMQYTTPDSHRIVPVDSEHSAIFQALQAGRREEVRRIILTTSGGPFLKTSKLNMERATPEEALKHPVWAMGKKISIDSATMMNKALEIVEARWLFGIPASQIEVLVHPQSIIHSMVEFNDGSVIAQLSVPDMKTPIQYAFTYPARAAATADFLDLARIQTLTFQGPDPDRFPALKLGYRAAEGGGTLGAVMNAANEITVDAFLNRRIPFPRIVSTVEEVMNQHKSIVTPTLNDILEADRWARKAARDLLNL